MKIERVQLTSFRGFELHWQAATLRGNDLLDARFANAWSSRVVR